MGWYNHKNIRAINKEASVIKEASARDIANNAIQLLNNGLAHGVAKTIFINQMKNENPMFDASPLGGINDANSLQTYLQGISSHAGFNAPPTPPAPPLTPYPSLQNNIGDIPGMQDDIGDIPGMQDDIGDIPGIQDDIGDIPGIQDIDFEPLQEEEVFQEDSIPQGDFEPLQEESSLEISVEEIPITPVQQIIEEEGTAQDIQEMEEEVPELEQRDEFEDMTLTLRPEDMSGEIEEVKHIEQKEFSIPATYKVKNDNLNRLTHRIQKINQYKDSKGQSPMAIRFRTQDGQPSSEPVLYQKEKINPNTGESYFAEYVDFVLEGEPPNPLGNPVKEIKNPDGTVSYEEVVYQIIGSIQIVPIEGYEPKEEKFRTEAEAKQHAEEMNLKDPTRRYQVGKANKSQKFKELYPETDGKFYPSTYIGKWRTIVDHYPNTPAWKQEYKEGSPLDCDHCGTKKRGMSSRRSVYVAIEYPAAQLITESGKPRDPLPEEIMKGKQVWIGTRCVEGQKGALQFINDLSKFKEVAMGAEKTGRASDSFGGSMSSPKGIIPIMANYFAAGNQRPGRGGNWFKKRYGNDLSPQDFKEFKKYYFGRKRSDMRKAAIEVHEWEKATEEYPTKFKEYEKAMRIYPYLMEQWIENGSIPEAKPPKPQMPSKPSETPPPGPEPLPWGETSEEHLQKAQEVIAWWKEKANDPTINYNDLEVNEELGASGERMHNLISIAMSGKIDSNFFHYLPELVEGFNRDKRMKQREEEERQFRTEQGFEKPRHIVDTQPIEQPTEQPIGYPPQPIEQPVGQPIAPEVPVGGQDFAQIPAGGEISGQFVNIGTKESRTGRYSDFRGPDGETYRVFDKYKVQRRDPKYDFQEGQTYTLNGIKGERSDIFRNTPLNRVSVVDSEIAAPEAAPEAVPEAAPVNREPVENTIIGDEERNQKIERIGKLADYAKNVIETGKTRDTHDEWGNKIPGKEMTPEELIPIYTAQVAKTWPAFNKNDFDRRLTQSLAENGREGLLNQINLIPIMARNLL